MDLAGKFLIAMPGMQDPRFAHSVILMLSHGPGASMGLIINKPVADVAFSALAAQVGIKGNEDLREVPVLFGGPVEAGRGFVLHGSDWTSSAGTMEVTPGLAVTATLEAIDELAHGRGPGLAMMVLGYAGWGAGQLDAEIARNDWLTCDADAEIALHVDMGRRWSAALSRLKVDPVSLSAAAGRA